jgi:cytochrome c556
MKLAMDMRTRAGALARQASVRDWTGSKEALADLAGACNRCHQTFRIPVRIPPKHQEAERDTSLE